MEAEDPRLLSIRVAQAMAIESAKGTLRPRCPSRSPEGLQCSCYVDHIGGDHRNFDDPFNWVYWPEGEKMKELTWEEKLEACKALGPDCELHMRQPGNWYVSQSGVCVSDSHFESGKYGNGSTPEEACIDHFKVLTECLRDGEVVVSRYCGNTRRVRWNGFMWRDA